jgi:hypothetical protein
VVNNSEIYIDSGLGNIGVLTTSANTKSAMPKMALGYTYKAEQFSLGVHGIFQTYSIDEYESPMNGVAITAAANNKAKTDTLFQLHNTFGYGFSASGGYTMGFLQINAGLAFDEDKNTAFESSDDPSGIDNSVDYFADFMFFIKPNLRLTPTIKVINYLNTAGNVFQSYDDKGQPLPMYKKEGVLARFGLAFQASI